MKLLLLLSTLVLAQHIPVFKDADFVFLGSNAPKNVGNWCIELVAQHPSLGVPSCRKGGDLMRNQDFSAYVTWLEQNMQYPQSLSDLASRSKPVQTKLKDLEAVYVFIFAPNNKVALFFGGQRFPLKTATLSTTSPTSLQLEFLEEEGVKAPSAKEKLDALKAPNKFYGEEVPLDIYYRFGLGYMTGFGGERNGSIIAYNKNSSADSTSAWSWITQESFIRHFEIGMGYHRFAQLGIYLDHANFSAKYNKSDTLQNDIQKWIFTRYEIGINVRLGKSYILNNLEVFPFINLGIHQTLYNEEFADNSFNPEKEKRLELQSNELGHPKGGTLQLGTQFLYKNKWALVLEAGFANRSLPDRESGTAEHASAIKTGDVTPQLIANNANEWTGKIVLVYNIRYWN